VPPEGDWPDRKGNVIEVAHPRYRPYDFFEVISKDVGDILLEPQAVEGKKAKL